MRKQALPCATAVVAAAIALGACGSAGFAGGRRVRVLAAENFYGSVASQIGGARVSVRSLLSNPAVDPHEYTGSTRDTDLASQARLVIVNGAGYDGFMDKLLDAAPSSSRRVIRVDRLVRPGPDDNPHLWYDPRVPVALARALVTQLSEIDPAGAAGYRQSAARFIGSLEPIRAEVASLRRRFAGTPFAYTERVAGYLTDAIGLRPLNSTAFATADEVGSDPPSQAVARMRDRVGRHEVRLLLYNRQASSKAAASLRQLAQRSGVPVVAVSETSPPGETYQQWQLSELRSIDAALSER